jgi:hypothetical protein
MRAVPYRELLATLNHFICLDAGSLCFGVEFAPSAIRVVTLQWSVNVATHCIPKIVFAINNTIPFVYANNSKVTCILACCVIL